MPGHEKAKNVSIALVRRIRASKQSVYDAWTQPRIIAKWLAPGGDFVTGINADVRPGGRYRIEGCHAEGASYVITGTYLDLADNDRVVMSWAYDGPVAALRGNGSVVTAELRSIDTNLTELTLTHDKLGDRDGAEITRVSWNSCANKLESITALEKQNDDRDEAREFFSSGHREMQDRFKSRPLADRLEAVLVREKLGAADASFIARQNMFFLATVDIYGQPNCSYKGGKSGFVTVIDDNTIAFPVYDGNGMQLSTGNILETNKVSLLFIDFERQSRMRILGHACFEESDPLLDRYPGAQLIVRVTVDSVFSNCPRYIHKMKLIEESAFVPTDDHETPVPGWKKLNAVADVLTDEDKHVAGTDTDLNKTLNRD